MAGAAAGSDRRPVHESRTQALIPIKEIGRSPDASTHVRVSPPPRRFWQGQELGLAFGAEGGECDPRQDSQLSERRKSNAAYSKSPSSALLTASMPSGDATPAT